MISPLFKEQDLISQYTSNQAIEDGFLFDLDQLPHRKLAPTKAAQTPLKYATTNLMSKGYLNPDNTLNLQNIKELITQSNSIFSKMPTDDYFISGKIELPDGTQQQIFIAQNETGRFTVMLPEDY